MAEKLSQSKKIIEYLKQGNSITQMEAASQFQCWRLGARIYDLRSQGYDIITEEMPNEHGGTHARYRLVLPEIN